MKVAPGTVSDALLHAAGSTKGIRIVEHDGRSLSLPYASLLRSALTIGGALHAAGVRPGAHVALVLPEVHDFVRAYFGITVAGFVPVPLSPPPQAGDIDTFARQSRHIIEAGHAAAVIASADVAPLLDVDGVTPPVAILAMDGLTGGPALDAPVPVGMDAIGLLQFTSGSTAAPKGVVLTHANLCANITGLAGPQGLDVRDDDVGVSWLPLYHDMGLIGMVLASAYAVVDTVLMSSVLFLKRPTAWLEAISRHAGTISFAPNFAYELCLRRVKPSQIAGLDLSTWRVAGCGAEPIRPDTLRAFAERFASAGFRASAFVPSYGLAESSLAVSFARDGVVVDTVDGDALVRQSVATPCADDAPRPVRVVGCGRPFSLHELRIVDDAGHELPERHVGSIVVRGPSVMQGYFEDPVATADALDADGWLRTGDLGYIAGGQLFICGRTKDLIIQHGRKYHPPDLESAIADLPGVRPSGVVVFGINHVDEVDEVVAVLEARASVATGADLPDQVRRRVRETAGLELDRVVVAPPGTIPRTTSGKVRRSETRDRFRAGTLVTG